MSGPPPPPFPVAGLPPPPMPAGVPPIVGRGPPHVRRPGGPPPPRNPFTGTVLLTGVPFFSHTVSALREWIFPCGAVRSAVCFPRPRQADHDEDEEAIRAENESRRYTLLVTFAHTESAVKLAASFKRFLALLHDDAYSNMQAHLVPASPDVPLPPPILDRIAQNVIGEKLSRHFANLEASRKTGNRHSASGNNAKSKVGNVNGNGVDDPESSVVTAKLDSSKTAAAAGGSSAYDVDEDPLNAPEVLQAVRDFRRKLGRAQTSQQKRRVRLVREKLDRLRPIIRERRKQEIEIANKHGTLSNNAPPSLPPPPLPAVVSGLPPPPSVPGTAAAAAVPPAVAAQDTGKRKHSNLPAWMTKQQKQQPSDTDQQSNKKAKTTQSLQDAINFPTLPATAHAMLQTYLTQQIQEVLGEAEDSLIRFIHGHVVSGKPIAELETEIKDVLDEDTPAFLQQLWSKVQELV